ncbi:hypothetical protein MGU_10829 [Metarhizium guizhouense ARSEF 977]|uniref:Uncharacterized protein n=1 Tax=Metarhizium guizhouense (strain ARSEF 977) TaxID=1276136 RepID=A0A0B4GWD4_METGA|nr:hypothetical protein MGU_10829 [Metarhizium guizhouense ARSEF 977]
MVSPILCSPGQCPTSTLGSTSSGLRLSLDGPLQGVAGDFSPLPNTTFFGGDGNNFLVRLPSLEEFDLGVEALARSYGSARPSATPLPPPPPSLRQISMPSQPLSLRPIYRLSFHRHVHVHNVSRPDSHLSPSPDGENRHINQKYTTEEGDFILYSFHDKKLKWQRIKQDFDAMFGRTPERTIQGLQRIYYRMNQRLPLWDQDGWLIFGNDDDIKPKCVSIKCRQRDSQDNPMEPPGLAQRYPERAIHYSWVDPELKRVYQDWAAEQLQSAQSNSTTDENKENESGGDVTRQVKTA